MNDPDLFIRLIEISAGLSSLTLALVFVALLAIRISNGIARKRRATLTSRWRAIFVTAFTGAPPPDPLPEIGRRDWFTVLQLFDQFHTIRENARHRASSVFPILDAMARQLGLDAYALSLLGKKSGADRVTALNVLGHLRDSRAFDTAAALSTDDGPQVSRAAALAALRIDPKFVDRLLELIRGREDWPRPRVETMLGEVDSERLDRAMRKALGVQDEAGRTRLLDYVRLCSPAAARSMTRTILRRTSDVETVSAALRSLAPLAGEDDRAIALGYCRSPESAVALGALRILRKCVRPEDDILLRELTANRDYWVRLRAAEVLVELYGDLGSAERFSEQHPDRYARDAIRQALAERRRMDARRADPDRRVMAVETSA